MSRPFSFLSTVVHPLEKMTTSLVPSPVQNKLVFNLKSTDPDGLKETATKFDFMRSDHEQIA